MGYLTYEELKQDAENYKNALTNELSAFKANIELTSSYNNQGPMVDTSPQQVVKTDNKLVLILGLVIAYLVWKGKLK